MKKHVYIVFVFLVQQFVFAQVDLSQHVINSWGSDYNGSSLSVSSSVGEAVILTVSDSSIWLAQGFQQPEYSFSGLNVFQTVKNASCIGNNDGSIVITVEGGVGTYTYRWSDTTNVLPRYDSLSKGTYTVVVSDAGGATKSLVFIINEEPVICGEVRIYHGFSPNGDNYNDTWWVSGILNFPDNDVIIYNRWGDEIWKAQQYDNTNVVWKGENKNGNPVPDGTYFYVFRYGNKKQKGWVEISR